MRYLVGLSGGMDSAAVALALTDAGHDAVGVFLRFFDESDPAPARYVAEKLGIEFHVFDARREFAESVVADFAAEYARGRTPNPCALCNRVMKFASLCRAAEEFACDKVATGHYANVLEEDGRFFVRAGADKSRDQSYFLWRVSQEELQKTEMILADAKKRELSSRVGDLLPKGTRESREVCFVPADDRISFLEKILPEEAKRAGDFTDAEGRVLARHGGIFRYTVGQRRGFGTGFGKRVYVKAIDAENARVILSDREACEGDSCRLSSVNFQKLAPQDGTYRVLCRVRYRAPLLPAVLTVEGDEARVKLQGEARAIFAPGQSLVCYDGEENVLCGGVIEPNF
ncbi:MAG: tRNA 2-thiouridine(34) synthase MnmA [Clostridia bacterium]|nr:tRNA 2-thiouridine(34) synthase MnmA [Clostridia bacterium]